MSTLTTAIEQQLRQNYQRPIIKTPTQGIWYTGADLLEDAALCRTSLQQQAVTPGQTILISLINLTTLPALLLASWQLNLTVQLTPPTATLPQLAPQRYAAMVYPPAQMQQLAQQLNPTEISRLPLLLNTAPDFAYFVHDLAPKLTTATPPALILAAGHAYSLADLKQAANSPSTPVIDIYDFETGIRPLLATLLNLTPFTLAAG
ncbi:hypothetical protein C5Z26_09150 [Lactobacillus sp. CBA3606]|uniref:hypothetical protein n=1 Tax=Lactobacillus sp. CBA3606 TaxID=2099789 RepID=UPI000CFC4F64|nr:hypothetical protein [Lactobacillus sp. CBA3606]AVK64267.1 hypothetical protein C5Z26_09150 [Lactobacillus sp. CBA3606]